MRKIIFTFLAIFFFTMAGATWAQMPVVFINNGPVPSDMLIMKDGAVWISAQDFLEGFQINNHISYLGPSVTVDGRDFNHCIISQNTVYVPLIEMTAFIGGKWEQKDDELRITYEVKKDPPILKPPDYQPSNFEGGPPDVVGVHEVKLMAGEKDEFMGSTALLMMVKIANESYSYMSGTYLVRISLVDEKNLLVSRVDITVNNMNARERKTIIVDFSRSFQSDPRARYTITTPLLIKKILSDDSAEVIQKYDWQKKTYTVHPVSEICAPDKP